MSVETLERMDAVLQRFGLRLGWHGLYVDQGGKRGYVGLTWLRDMTPWYWSTEKACGIWSLPVHVPGLQFQVIGPFRRRKS